MKIMKIPTLTATVTASIVTCGTPGINLHAQTSDPALNALVKKGILTEKEAKEALAETQAQANRRNPHQLEGWSHLRISQWPLQGQAGRPHSFRYRQF
jgi:hypothetical protein